MSDKTIRMVGHPVRVIWLILVTLLPASLMLAWFMSLTATAQPGAATLSITTATTSAKINDPVIYNFTIVGTGIQTEVIFYAEIPPGTVYSAVEGATPQTYTIGLRSASEIKSISWIGMLTETHRITLTTLVSGPGAQINGDILVEGLLIYAASGSHFFSAFHVTDYLWPQERYLPLALNGFSGLPGGTPTPTGTPEDQEITGIKGWFQSYGDPTYEQALNAGGPIQFQQPQNQSYVGQQGIDRTDEGFGKGYRIDRSYIDFDTTTITSTPTTATLYVKITRKTAGMILPQVIHRGTWSGSATVLDIRHLWSSFDSVQQAQYLETDAQGYDPSNPLELYISLSPAIVQPGELTHLVIRSGEEGTPPPQGNDACVACTRRLEYTDIRLILVW